MSEARIVSLRTGRVRTRPRPDWDRAEARTWDTAYAKDEAPGALRVTFDVLEGDEYGEPEFHGGPEQVVLAYAFAHYADWRTWPGLEAMGPGGFAENLTIDGLDESGVCIGDVYAVGDVRLQVSQPRGPCASISRYWNSPELLKRVVANGRTGWYHRVLAEGTIARDMTCVLESRAWPEFTIARLNALHTGRERDAAACAAIAACPQLSPEWRAKFAEHASKHAG